MVSICQRLRWVSLHCIHFFAAVFMSFLAANLLTTIFDWHCSRIGVHPVRIVNWLSSDRRSRLLLFNIERLQCFFHLLNTSTLYAINDRFSFLNYKFLSQSCSFWILQFHIDPTLIYFPCAALMIVLLSFDFRIMLLRLELCITNVDSQLANTD